MGEIIGDSIDGVGVTGKSIDWVGVMGTSVGNTAVWGTSDKGLGILGQSKTNTGVFAKSDQGIGIFSTGGSLAGLFEGDVEVTGDVRLIGNVGIGIDKPTHKFHVVADDAVGLLESTGTQAYLRLSTKEGLNNRVEITNRPGGKLSLWTAGAGDIFNITRDGKVGIGTTNPTEKLEVNGNIKVTGDVFLTNADCAEEFDVAGADSVEPGTVMVIDRDGGLRPSEQAYDKRVAGVISGAGDLHPGITLDKKNELANRLPLALTGKVYCKIDAQHGSVDVGDLLTTSPTSGHAMKASDPIKAFGSVIGKALQPMEMGRGIIPILVALQ